ncbi:alpha/beta-hydrolase [Schizophyllum commune H4-8]|uniref:Alpha/beta hydrolase fold-3 domain-containing protein n=1 Tax=Schizophyllum commune (strain H4-8 / FGSC 9210) TaxID=578458 RepID=D8PR69_SCHCM|nr:alpha/beta-hydrolase [Schizophyllum commune H4-8]KAI5898069.1 alpha/beta-hydrolase [Schizophyllum commune H4-8]
MVWLPWNAGRALCGLPAATEKVPAQPQLTQDPKSLVHYKTPGVAPPSARVDHGLRELERPRLSIWQWWRYPALVAYKTTELAQEMVHYTLWGPRKPSWGIEMTLINALMRGAAQHSALVDIGAIRMVLSLAGMVPIPSDAIVTPVSFRVRRRGLRGMLAEFDVLEDGSRTLYGEWVVGRRTWQRLQTEWHAARTSEKAGGAAPSKQKKETVILYIHGGAYYLSSAAGQRLISIPLSKYTDCRVFAIDYRLAPETKFPGPLHDVVSAYLRLVEDLQIPAANIVIAGDSAGGGLTTALLLYLRDNDYPLPSGAILMSPWVDLTMSCESWETNAVYDVVPMPDRESHMHPVALYLGENIERYVTHPYASPLFGDFHGIPPLLIQAGDSEVLRDEITLLAHKATLAGVKVRHELYEDAVHIFQTYPFLESAHRAFLSMREFVRNAAPDSEKGTIAESAERELEREMETKETAVVSGDGVEETRGVAGLEAEEAVVPSESEDDRSSWRRSDTRWLAAPESDEEGEEEPPVVHISRKDKGKDKAKNEWVEETREISPEEERTPTTPPRRRRAETLSNGHLRRLQGAFAHMFPQHNSPPPARPCFSRVKSSYSALPKRPGMPAFTVADHERTEAHHISRPSSRLSNASPTSSPTMPSPSIRRKKANSMSASHPDIASLVNSWRHDGPANETLMFQPMGR